MRAFEPIKRRTIKPIVRMDIAGYQWQVEITRGGNTTLAGLGIRSGCNFRASLSAGCAWRLSSALFPEGDGYLWRCLTLSAHEQTELLLQMTEQLGPPDFAPLAL